MVFFGCGCGMGEGAVGQSDGHGTTCDGKSACPRGNDLSQPVGAMIYPIILLSLLMEPEPFQGPGHPLPSPLTPVDFWHHAAVACPVSCKSEFPHVHLRPPSFCRTNRTEMVFFSLSSGFATLGKCSFLKCFNPRGPSSTCCTAMERPQPSSNHGFEHSPPM